MERSQDVKRMVVILSSSDFDRGVVLPARGRATEFYPRGHSQQALSR
jgi:hypothetical protein